MVSTVVRSSFIQMHTSLDTNGPVVSSTSGIAYHDDEGERWRRRKIRVVTEILVIVKTSSARVTDPVPLNDGPDAASMAIPTPSKIMASTLLPSFLCHDCSREKDSVLRDTTYRHTASRKLPRRPEKLGLLTTFIPSWFRHFLLYSRHARDYNSI